jgi:trans-2,3-dihydro-3-hydroxyanthranilate isomerase
VIAEMLSIDPGEIDSNCPLQVISCGVPFLYVPLTNLAALRRIKLRYDLWEQQLKDFASPHLFVFTLETELEKSAVHCRMFAPALGIAEDPATGAASGPLGCYLVKYGLVGRQLEGKVSFISEQGFEMGRPSLIYIEIEQAGEQISAVRVGGQCVYMGEGYFELPEA